MWHIQNFLKLAAATVLAFAAMAQQASGQGTGVPAPASQSPAAEPQDAAGYLKRGQDRLNQGEYDGAIDDFGEVLERNAKETKALFGLALALIGKADRETPGIRQQNYLLRAISFVNQIVNVDPANAAAYSLRADARVRTYAYAGAIMDYDQALRLAPGDERAARGRAEAMQAMSCREDAARVAAQVHGIAEAQIGHGI